MGNNQKSIQPKSQSNIMSLKDQSNIRSNKHKNMNYIEQVSSKNKLINHHINSSINERLHPAQGQNIQILRNDQGNKAIKSLLQQKNIQGKKYSHSDIGQEQSLRMTHLNSKMKKASLIRPTKQSRIIDANDQFPVKHQEQNKNKFAYSDKNKKRQVSQKRVNFHENKLQNKKLIGTCRKNPYQNQQSLQQLGPSTIYSPYDIKQMDQIKQMQMSGDGSLSVDNQKRRRIIPQNIDSVNSVKLTPQQLTIKQIQERNKKQKGKKIRYKTSISTNNGLSIEEYEKRGYFVPTDYHNSKQDLDDLFKYGNNFRGNYNKINQNRYDKVLIEPHNNVSDSNNQQNYTINQQNNQIQSQRKHSFNSLIVEEIQQVNLKHCKCDFDIISKLFKNKSQRNSNKNDSLIIVDQNRYDFPKDIDFDENIISTNKNNQRQTQTPLKIINREMSSEIITKKNRKNPLPIQKLDPANKENRNTYK